MSHLTPATSVPQPISGSGFKALSPLPAVPLGAVFVLQLLQSWLRLGFWKLLSLHAGYFQGPQAPCPTGISSYRWSAFGVHGNNPVGTDVPCIFGSQYCKQDGSCTVDWEVQLSPHMVELIAKHLVEFSHEFLEFFFPKKDLMPVIFQYVVWKLFFFLKS